MVQFQFKIIFFITFISLSIAQMEWSDLKCLVCRAVVEEIETEVSKETSKKMVEVGGYRLDSDGNTKQKMIPYARSEMHLHDVLENICDKMSDYVRGVYKDTGDPTILKIITSDGKMNPDMGKVDLEQDPRLNDALKFHCSGIIEEQEDELIKLFTTKSNNIDIKLCSDILKACTQTAPDEDYEFHEEL